MQFFLIALIFAAASFMHIVLQAPPSQVSLMKYEHFFLLRTQGSRSTHKSLSRTQEWAASDCNEVFCIVI